MSHGFDQVSRDLLDRHRQDPRPKTFGGVTYPYEAIYAQRMLHWTKHINPAADETLLLAVDAQHLERWQLPRESFTMDRKGYLLWREELKKRHADQLAGLMQLADYSNQSIEKATRLIRRKQLADDPDGQTLEDAACLVFLELDFDDLMRKTEREKMITILQKTWKKMSPLAHDLALGLSFDADQLALIKAALAPA